MPELHDISKDIVCILKHVPIMKHVLVLKKLDSKTTKCDGKQTIHQITAHAKYFDYLSQLFDDGIDMMMWLT